MAKPKLKPDYFKLPFDVYYSDEVPVTYYQFRSNVNPKKFSDIKVAHFEQGYALGVSFNCTENNGPELFCCIKNYHDEVYPTWLSFGDEDHINFKYGADLVVKIEGNEIKFSEPSDEEQDEESEEYVDVDSMDYCCDALMAYHIGEASPDYLILDADGARVKVNLEGYVLDDDDEPTDERLFDPEELDEDDFSGYSQQELWDAKSEWVNGVLVSSFPKDKHLKLSFDTE